MVDLNSLALLNFCICSTVARCPAVMGSIVAVLLSSCCLVISLNESPGWMPAIGLPSSGPELHHHFNFTDTFVEAEAAITAPRNVEVALVKDLMERIKAVPSFVAREWTPLP
jgi:hypothetical protein